MHDLSGTNIKGYELRERIGAGGFGAVYRAFQPAVGREVAIKIVLPQYANHPEFIRRFEAEARMVARLEHLHIVPLYDYWREPDSAYLVMRYLRGGSLQDKLRRGALDTDTVLRVFDQIGAALAVAHAAGVIHRDLKPGNILLDEAGNAYLADFGIAKNLTEAAITQTGMLAGSPAYIAPEQVRGEDVTPQADVYSLGVMLFELLTGKHPFEGSPTTAMLVKHLSDPIPSLMISRSDLPEEVDEVVQKATAKELSDRYRDVPELVAALRTAFRTLGVDPTVSQMERLRDTAYLEDAVRGELLNPYKGLRAFQEADSVDFFGRDALVTQIRRRLLEDTSQMARFLAVVGPSGSGKSSVVKAGLIPTLRQDSLSGAGGWFIVEMVPTARPLEELEAALLRIAINPPASLLQQLKEDDRGLLRASKRVLPQDDTQLFLLIDQFEEVFTQVEDEAERAHLLNSLFTAVTDPGSRVRVIVTLRADFYDKPLLYPNFGELIRSRTELVLPLNPDELEAAITGPAKRVGIKLEPSLVAAIVADVQQQPGALPLLQYALTELFERREGRTMTLAAYREIGGTLGALARRADEIYESMTPAQQEAVHQMCLRLVTPGEGTDDTRRRVLQEELLSLSGDRVAMEQAIAEFGKYRLLTFDRSPATRSPTVEIAHEALIRQWGRLRRWLDDSREDLRAHRRLQVETEEWLYAKRDRSYLGRGTRLAQYEEWLKTTRLALTAVEREYLDASIAAHQADEAREAERQAREEALEARSRRRLQLLVAVFAFATVIASILGVFAFTQFQAAQEAQKVAEQRADETSSIALAANAVNAITDSRPTVALSLALESSTPFQPPLAETERTLAQVAYAPGASRAFSGHSDSVTSAVFSPDGTQLLTASADMTLRIWDAQSGEELRQLTGHTAAINHAIFSPDGTLIASAAEDNSVRIWDAATGELLRTLEGHTAAVNALAFSPDSVRIVSASDDKSLIFWNTADGTQQRVIAPGDVAACGDLARIRTDCTGHVAPILDVAWSADGRFIASSGGQDVAGEPNDRVARVWNAETGALVQVMRPDDEYVGLFRTVDISDDGSFVLTASYDLTGGIIRLWNVSSGNEVRQFTGHNDVITGLAFSPDGQQFISGSWDRTVRRWDLRTGLEAQRFIEHTDYILSVAYSPDGEYVLSSAGRLGAVPNDARVLMWDLRSRVEVTRFRAHQSWVWTAAYSPDGAHIITGSGRLQNADGDNSIRIWDMLTGEQVQVLSGHGHVVSRAVYSPDGRRIASSSWDRTVRLWDVATGAELARYEGHIRSVNSVAFSPDGQYLLTGSSDWTMHLLRIDAGAEGITLEPVWTFGTLRAEDQGNDNNFVFVLFSPDGRYALGTSRDKMAHLVDVGTGEEVRRFEGHTSRLEMGAFNADGSLLATASWDGSAIVWDVATGAIVQRFTGHNGFVIAVAFTPDGEHVLSGASDNSVRQWRIASGEETRRYDGHSNWVLSIMISPDGGTFVTGAEDNTARVWLLHSTQESLIAWAEVNRYVRPLTAEEQAQYRIGSE